MHVQWELLYLVCVCEGGLYWSVLYTIASASSEATDVTACNSWLKHPINVHIEQVEHAGIWNTCHERQRRLASILDTVAASILDAVAVSILDTIALRLPVSFKWSMSLLQVKPLEKGLWTWRYRNNGITS